MTGADDVDYQWSLNGTVQAITETFEVPASAKSGDRITVTVTNEDGETASDTVYVGGFTILMVEPTTDAAAANGYKYLRAEFSSALTDLQPEDIVIRAKKDKQLYSVDTVKLSSDGKSADITLFGSVLEGGTTFLKAGTIYTMTITKDGSSDTYEFELPDNQADLLVTAVDIENGIITTASTWSATRDAAGTKDGDYKIGDLYNGNLGDLVGRTVNLGLNSDREVVDFSVNDAEVIYAAVQAKDGNSDTHFGESKKDYFQAADKTKYYLSDDETSSVTETYTITGVGDTISTDWYNTGTSAWVTGTVTTDSKWDYAKLVLNPTGTVSCAVLENWQGLIVATSAEDGVATETKNNTKDFSKFTVVEGGLYVDPDDISDGDVIYYNDTDKFAEIYNASVTGELEKVYTSSAVVEGTEYKWDGIGEPYATTARYYDDDNDKYVTVDEKWLLAADTTEDVTFTLDRNNNAVLIETVQGETVTTTHDYIITKAPVAYLNGVDEMVNIGVSDGTAETLKIKVSDLKYVGNDTKDSWSIGTGATTYTTPLATKTDDFKFKGKDQGLTTNTAATDFPVDALLRVKYDEDGTVIGLKKIANTTTLKNDDVALKPGLTELATQAGKVALTDDTNIYIITGEETDNSDMKVTKVAYGDFDKTTRKGVEKIDNPTTGTAVYTLVKVYVDKTTATDIVIDASAKTAVTENKIFADNETKSSVVGVVKSVKTGLGSDKETTELKEFTLLNYAGETTYDDLKAGLTTTAIKDKIVKVDLDADGQVIAVTPAVDAAGTLNAAAVGKYEDAARLASTSTEYVRVGNDFIRPTAKAFIATWDGNSYTTTSIGAINRETTKLNNIIYYVSEIQGDDISSEIIIAYGSTAPTPVTLGATVTLGTAAWTLPAAAGTDTFTTTLSFVDSATCAVSADELTVGTITTTDVKTDGTATYAISGASFANGTLTATLTGDGVDPTADASGTIVIPVKYNGADYNVTVTVAKDGALSAGAATV